MPKKIVLIAFRLSLILALIATGLGAWKNFNRYQAEQRHLVELKRAYECASKFSDEVLTGKQGSSGNINVGEEPFNCSSRTFYVALHELREVRNGTMPFKAIFEPFDWLKTSMEFGFAFIAVNLLGLFAALALVVGRWIVRPLTENK